MQVNIVTVADPVEAKAKAITTLRARKAVSLGVGMFSNVVTDPADPDSRVIKVGVGKAGGFRGAKGAVASHVDAYCDFVLTAHRRGLIGVNPFLPRVTDLTLMLPENKQIRQVAYFVRMERLLSAQEVDYSVRRTALMKIHSSIDQLGVITEIVERRTLGQMRFPSIHSVTLLTLLKSLSTRHGGDLHAGNIMYRRTPEGMVPVITDPVA